MALLERLRAASAMEDDLREVFSFGELLVEQQQQIEALKLILRTRACAQKLTCSARVASVPPANSELRASLPDPDTARGQ